MADCAQFRIHFEPLPRCSLNNTVARVWVSAGGISFPDPEWTDFALDVITLWALELLMPWTGRKRLQFVDGDDAFFLERAGGGVSIHFPNFQEPQAADQVVRGMSEEHIVREVLHALDAVLASYLLQSYSAEVLENCVALRAKLELQVRCLAAD